MNCKSYFRLAYLAPGVLLMVGESRAQDASQLVQQLGSPNYQMRERAQQLLLTKMRNDDAFERLRGPFKDPEIERRAEQIRRAYVDQLKPDTLPTLPWIDMLPATGHPGAQQIMHDYLSRSGGHGRAPVWAGDVEATRLWVADLISQRVPPDEIRKILNLMAEAQKKTSWYDAYLKAVKALP